MPAGRQAINALRKGNFRVVKKTTSRAIRREGITARSIKTDAHVNLEALIMASIFGTFDGTQSEGSELVSMVSDKMDEIYRNNGVIVSGGVAAPPWAPLKDSTIRNKGGEKIMFDSGELIRVVRGGGLEATAFIESGKINYAISWPEDEHDNGNGLTIADIAAILELGARGKGFEIEPRPWLSRALLALADDLGNDIVVTINANALNASRAVQAASQIYSGPSGILRARGIK